MRPAYAAGLKGLLLTDSGLEIAGPRMRAKLAVWVWCVKGCTPEEGHLSPSPIFLGRQLPFGSSGSRALARHGPVRSFGFVLVDMRVPANPIPSLG